MHPNTEITRRDIVLAFVLAVLLGVAYASFIQTSLTFDGAFFVHEELKPIRHHFETHLLFGPWLRLALVIGGAFHLSPRVAGSLQSVVTMACAIGLLFLAMRRCGVRRPYAFIFTLLMACTAPAIENATTVEVYGLAFLAIMLSLHAFIGEATKPTRTGAVCLLAANVLIAWIHVGWCFWILSCYLALAISEQSPAKVIRRLAQGFCVLFVLIDSKYFVFMIGERPSLSGELMYQFYRPQSLWSHLVNTLLAPTDSIQAFAGFAVFPAILGWRLERHRLRALAIHALIALVLFAGFFHAWTIDLGNFYLPVMALAVIFAALGTQSVFDRGDRFVLWILAAAALLLVPFFILPFQVIRFYEHWIQGRQYRIWLGVLFYVLAFVQWILAGRLLKNKRTNPLPRLAAPACAVAALALMLFCYLPRPLFYLRPDQTHDYVIAVNELMRGRELSTQRLITRFQPEHIEVETGIQCCAAWNIGRKASEGAVYDQNPPSEWVRNSARAEDTVHVWIDAVSLNLARKLWDRGVMADIPIDLLPFRPVMSDAKVSDAYRLFYEISFKNPADARIYAQRLDPYPAEIWGKTEVTHTRPAYEQRLRRGGEWLEFKYWVGNPGIGPNHPVRVEIFLNGELVESKRYVRKECPQVRIHVPASMGPEVTLSIRTSPGYRAKEGRDLGVALHPFQWKN